MTQDEFSMAGGRAAAARAFTTALAGMGGQAAPGDPARGVVFTLRKGGNIFSGTGAPYAGRARIETAGPGRSRISVELTPRPWYGVLGVAVAALVFGLLWVSAEGAGEQATALRGVGLAFCVATGIVLYLYHRSWPQALLDELRLRLEAVAG